MDADGIRIQLSPENGWSFLRPPTFAPDTVAVRDEPVFRPAGIEHVLLNVADPDASAGFYEKIFGPVALRNNNRIWFRLGRSRIGLLKTPDGQRPGVDYFLVSAAPSPTTLLSPTTALGAKSNHPNCPAPRHSGIGRDARAVTRSASRAVAVEAGRYAIRAPEDRL